MRNGCISIHAPRTAADYKLAQQFQSTLPARGATLFVNSGYLVALFQSTLPARGATSRRTTPPPRTRFQSTPPARGATLLGVSYDVDETFQSTLPARGATVQHRRDFCVADISIHAPRTGSDRCFSVGAAALSHFNPRSPHGERRILSGGDALLDLFQSTLPARGATSNIWRISRVGRYFNPRSPHGERLHQQSDFGL